MRNADFPGERIDTMDLDHDDIAGVLDLFGGLTREELDRALEEFAFRAGDQDSPDEYPLDDALEEFAVVEFERPDGGTLLVPGPTAFPTVPEHAEDLPRILDVDRRSIDRVALGEAAVERFRAEAAAAVDEGNEDRVSELLDLTYDLEAWAPVDVATLRDRLDAALESERTGDGPGSANG
ncbi:MAG: hypothetical protein ACI9YT_000615 [Halobacteriales archaeon]